MGEFYQGNLEEAVAEALRDVDGAYGLAFISADEPGVLVAARKGSPLLVGVGENECFVASDASPLLQYTRSVVYLDDGELVVLTRDGYRVRNLQTIRISKPVNQIDWDLAMVERNGFPHFMLKEICEQPESLCNTLRGHLLDDEGTSRVSGLNLSDDELKQVERIVITACGTSWHSGLIGEYMLEEMARIPVEVEYASEFRYRNPVVDQRTLVIGISQSGETADTLAAIREAKRRGARTVGLVNVVGSTIAREVDGGIYLHAGPEVGVASTKAFTSQVAALALVTLRLARLRNLSILQGRQFIEALRRLPEQIADILERASEIEALAERFLRSTSNALYLGRGVNFPVALEGALKLKEISYIHAEGYPAAEMKHGPIALIDENMPVVFIAPRDAVHSKIVSNIEEVKARGRQGHRPHQRGRHRDRAPGRCDVHHPGHARHADADPHEHSAAAAVVLRGGGAGVQRGPAEEPGEVGDGGIALDGAGRSSSWRRRGARQIRPRRLPQLHHRPLRPRRRRRRATEQRVHRHSGCPAQRRASGPRAPPARAGGARVSGLGAGLAALAPERTFCQNGYGPDRGRLQLPPKRQECACLDSSASSSSWRRSRRPPRCRRSRCSTARQTSRVTGLRPPARCSSTSCTASWPARRPRGRSPTFRPSSSAPGCRKHTQVGFLYSTNSTLTPNYPNEWEFYGRWLPLSQDRGAALDLGGQVGYNLSVKGLDGEI